MLNSMAPKSGRVCPDVGSFVFGFQIDRVIRRMSNHNDRNFLVGMFALQAGLIRSDQLLAAMYPWTFHEEQDLENILYEQKALSVENLRLLKNLVGQYKCAHSERADQQISDVDAVCDKFYRACCNGEMPQIEDYLCLLPIHRQEELLQELLLEEFHLRQINGATIKLEDYTARFPLMTEVVAKAVLAARAVEQDASLGSRLTHRADIGRSEHRFRVIRRCAKGGLGEVFLAQDTELNREVALKEIQARHAHDASIRARFLLEAEITGRLEHPGIVPVYGLGRYSDGRPYYAMRFIQGDSLKESIEQFHNRLTGTDDLTTGEAGVEFRRLLTRFVTVCEALEYAHSRGIVHRDLKPSNIMLGKYGETLVVDWGLAKVLAWAQLYNQWDKPSLTSGLGSDASGTTLGSTLGTPIFMSPEQAAGRVDELNPATDIYSLGATLYQLLTGQPPFVGHSAEEILRRVQAGEFPRPSDVAKVTTARTRHGKPSGTPRPLAVPKPLEAICLKAMSRKAEDRYPSAAALAADIECYLADEPVGALAEPTADRLRRWGRKNPTKVGSLAAGLVMLTMSLGLVAALVFKNNSVLAEANTKIKGQRRQITQQNVELRRANKAERQAAAEAQMRRQLAEAAEDQAKQAQTQAERSEALAKASELNALERSAEVAARRGDWEQTFEFIRLAESLSTDPGRSVRLKIEKAKGEWVLSRAAQARKTLEELRSQVFEGPLRPRILLWSAVIDSSLGSAMAQQWLREVGSLDSTGSLEPGERSLVRALLAHKSGEAIVHLRDLLSDEPFFPGAQHLLVVVYLFRGERDLAHREIEIARRLHPGDPNTAIFEALLLAIEQPQVEVEAQLPSLLAQIPEMVRPGLQKLVTQLVQHVDGLRSPSGPQPPLLVLLEASRAFAGFIEVAKNLDQDGLLLGPSILLGQRWFGAVLQPSLRGLSNPEGLLSDILEFDPMGDVSLLRGMLRRNRGAAAEAEEDLLAVANGGRLLLPLEPVAAAALIDTQIGLVRREKKVLESVDSSVRSRIVSTLFALRKAMERDGPPFGQDLQDWIELSVSLCESLGQTGLGGQFLDLWDERHPPTPRTLRIRGNLLRAAAVPDLFRALDCYQRALEVTTATDARRQELEDLVRMTIEEIQCRSKALEWGGSQNVSSP